MKMKKIIIGGYEVEPGKKKSEKLFNYSSEPITIYNVV